jgi:hypothetical protein
MNSAVNVGVCFPVNAVQGIQNSLWLLGGSSIVEINKLMAVYLLLKDRKLASDIRYVQHAGWYQNSSTKVR